jgi:two-component system, NarL family, response regulator NreC
VIRVLLADDHALMRDGLRGMLDAQPDMEVVGEAADGAEAVQKAVETRPDVALVDITMPSGGIGTIERMRQACPGTRVLVLTMHDTPAYLRSALAVGASGYVVKRAADSELLSAIRTVHRGHTVLDSDLAVMAVHGSPSRRPAGGQGAAPPLSAREREVLDLVAQGYTNQQIGERLGLSIRTVETYRSRLVEKLGLRSRADLVRYALDSGLFGPGPAAPEDPAK